MIYVYKLYTYYMLDIDQDQNNDIPNVLYNLKP